MKSNDKQIILSTRNITKSYSLGRSRQTVLQGVNLSVKRGEFLAIMGASGSGKSTLLHIMGLLDRPDEGEVHFEGESVFEHSGHRQDQIRNRDIGFVFQFYHLLPELNVMENVLLPMMVASSTLSWLGQRKKAREKVRDILTELGLGEQLQQRPVTLSGGERQRVALARALILKPRLLLADEPTGNLDSAAGKVILDILKKLNKEGQTIVMVTHDPAIADLADRTLVLRDGLLVK
ncbi:MAG: ABC transporter ATP-binding protein [Phycisphaerae bacterium]|nr:ABC transporter ATP-binding protein [Phycisphaerae bacterium]